MSARKKRIAYRHSLVNSLCALVWAGVGCCWFIRAYQGTLGTPWFNVVLGLACLATGGVYAYRAARDILKANRNKGL